MNNAKQLKSLLEKIDARIRKEEDKTDGISVGYVLAMRHCRGMIEHELLASLVDKVEESLVCKS